MNKNISYKRKNKKRKFKNFLSTILFILLVLLFTIKGVTLIEKNFFAVNTPMPPNSILKVEKDDKQKTFTSNEEDWCLIIINKDNPLSQNEYKVKTVELENKEKVDERIYSQLKNMILSAQEEGVYLVIVSGYRTYEEQKQIYNDRISAYRNQGLSKREATAEAQRWVAIPGTSEHQTGLAVDINADGVYSDGAQVYQWLADNAHLYGFINRYPQDKTNITGVANEPWHYRYVGLHAAKKIYEQGTCLEEYLDSVA